MRTSMRKNGLLTFVLAAASCSTKNTSDLNEAISNGNAGESIICATPLDSLKGRRAMLLDYYNGSAVEPLLAQYRLPKNAIDLQAIVEEVAKDSGTPLPADALYEQRNDLNKVEVNSSNSTGEEQLRIAALAAQKVIDRIKMLDPALHGRLSAMIGTFADEAIIDFDLDFAKTPSEGFVRMPQGCKIEQVATYLSSSQAGDKRYVLKQEIWNEFDWTSRVGLVMQGVLSGLAKVDYGLFVAAKPRHLNYLLAANAFQKLGKNVYINDLYAHDETYWKVMDELSFLSGYRKFLVDGFLLDLRNMKRNGSNLLYEDYAVGESEVARRLGISVDSNHRIDLKGAEFSRQGKLVKASYLNAHHDNGSHEWVVVLGNVEIENDRILGFSIETEIQTDYLETEKLEDAEAHAKVEVESQIRAMQTGLSPNEEYRKVKAELLKPEEGRIYYRLIQRFERVAK